MEYPKENGKYLCLIHFMNHYSWQIYSYANDLHKIDKYDFDKHKKGFYSYDSEYGCYEVDDVVYWQELPNIEDVLER